MENVSSLFVLGMSWSCPGQVCVVGGDVRVHERPSLPDLPAGLVGSFAFDSQKPYPTLAEVTLY